MNTQTHKHRHTGTHKNKTHKHPHQPSWASTQLYKTQCSSVQRYRTATALVTCAPGKKSTALTSLSWPVNVCVHGFRNRMSHTFTTESMEPEQNI